MEKRIYDNSNIAESYAGVTTPLTFSFVRYVYQEVYQHFSLMMGVSKKTIHENKSVFKHMVDFIGCRIYYNLNGWYTMLSFFPGYRFSSEFMEKMMGVEKALPVGEKETHQHFFSKYFIYFPKTILHFIKIMVTFSTLSWRISIFNRYFDNIFFKLDRINLQALDLKKLKGLYQEADMMLLSRWRVPIANDFAVMVSTGLADKLFQTWFDSTDAYLHMNITKKTSLISLDPGNKVVQITQLIEKDSKLKEVILGGENATLLKFLHDTYASHPVVQEIGNYFKQYGSRIPNELKLESESLAENSDNFFALLKKLIGNDIANKELPQHQSRNEQFKQLSIGKDFFLRWLLQWARNSIQRREEARFRRTLIFGFIRKVFLEIGSKFEQEGVIVNARDVFYLTIEEVFQIIDEKEISFIPAVVIENRNSDITSGKGVELPRRIETIKDIDELESELLNNAIVPDNYSEIKLAGRVASRPNKVVSIIGQTITLKDFDPNADYEGKILITCQTDPGWTIVFPFLRGIVVERGGMLSHAAIVARELNIPCVVGVQQATDRIPSDTTIRLDLNKGVIEKI